MPGLVPGIHVFLDPYRKQDVDGRDKPGHDGGEHSDRCEDSYRRPSTYFITITIRVPLLPFSTASCTCAISLRLNSRTGRCLILPALCSCSKSATACT